MFNWYVALLTISGIAMIAMAVVRNGQNTASRSLNLIFGAVYLGFAVYLAFLFDGGSYLIFFQAFILPMLMVVNFFRNRNSPKPRRCGESISAPPCGRSHPSPIPGDELRADPARDLRRITVSDSASRSTAPSASRWAGPCASYSRRAKGGSRRWIVTALDNSLRRLGSRSAPGSSTRPGRPMRSTATASSPTN